MLLSFSLTGVFLSVILLSFNRKKFGATIFLGFFFLTLSFYALSQYILLYSKSVTMVTLFLCNFASFSAFPFLIGPMLYWYIRSVLSDSPNLKRTDSLHLLPVILFFLVSIPQNHVPISQKVMDAINLYNDTNYIANFNGTTFSNIFSVEFVFLSRPGTVLIYTLFSCGLFIRYTTRNKKTGVLSGQNFMITWITLLLGLVLLLVISQMVGIARAFAMNFSETFFSLNLVRVLSGLGLIGLLISPFLFPSILYGLPRMPVLNKQLKPETRYSEMQAGKSEKTRYCPEEDYLLDIQQKIDKFMKENQPYLQPGFNLARLSIKTDVPVHHLGYFFREIKKQHFNEYRNEWRINHAKKLIAKGKASEITLEAIGMLSGFSSRNAFITDFKKFEGESPGSYASRFN